MYPPLSDGTSRNSLQPLLKVSAGSHRPSRGEVVKQRILAPPATGRRDGIVTQCVHENEALGPHGLGITSTTNSCSKFLYEQAPWTARLWRKNFWVCASDELPMSSVMADE